MNVHFKIAQMYVDEETINEFSPFQKQIVAKRRPGATFVSAALRQFQFREFRSAQCYRHNPAHHNTLIVIKIANTK